MMYFQCMILESMGKEVLWKLFCGYYMTQGSLFIAMMLLRPAFVERDEKIEAYIKNHRKEVKNFFCNVCGVSKIMRSFHCIYCNRCVAKWQVHTFWFNRCIDARNIFTYWLYLAVGLLLNLTSVGTCLYYNHVRTKQMPKPFLYMVLLIIQLVTLGKELRTYTGLIAKNLTFLEKQNWYKAIYMWANESRVFFNPFDRGTFNNFKQAIKSTFTCRKAPAVYELIELNATQTEDQKETNPDTTPENVIRAHDGTWDPDWVTYRIYNIFDITNSPLREKVLAYHQARVAQGENNDDA
eukprot:TRINITY_DN8040_c0_g1_i10.p1 TRINITY_DN8040_c0_g1~~TRINITY_DN8040_c0_g1_i10.p1  ORF type:complete len:295 (-),score=44.23 TRINITY_DN8040_c0_g1_i10:129-1013(-)